MLGYGFIDYNGERYYADPETGEVASNVTIVDGVPYFFGITKFKMMKGFFEYNGDLFYSNSKGILQTGMIDTGEGYYYFDSESYKATSGLFEIDNETYYFDPVTKKRASGVTLVDGKYYFFGIKYGKKMYGWINNNGTYYYADPTIGELATDWTVIDGKRYFFGLTTKRMMKGKLTYPVDGKVYYLNPNTGELVTGHQVINGNDYYCDEFGVLEKIQYNPPYYNQKDAQWEYLNYGLGVFRSTGCAPTVMAMAFSSILGKTILPTDVANYLYYNTNEFNKYIKGSTGMAIIYASNYYHVRYTPLTSKETLALALSEGKLVFAAMGNGRFATTTYNHAILLSRYQDGQTYAYDPLDSSKNGWVDINIIINEQSKDPDDSRGGSNFYALEEY